MLITTNGSRGRELHHCMPLTELRAERDASSLRLDRLDEDRECLEWARLNFNLYESGFAR